MNEEPLTEKKFHNKSDFIIISVIVYVYIMYVGLSVCVLDSSSVISFPDSKIHGANIGPTWVLLAQCGSHVSPMNLAIMDTQEHPFCFLSPWYLDALKMQFYINGQGFIIRHPMLFVMTSVRFHFHFSILILLWSVRCHDLTTTYSGHCSDWLWCVYISYAPLRSGSSSPVFIAPPSCFRYTWWRHQMEFFSALLALCAGNSPFLCFLWSAPE